MVIEAGAAVLGEPSMEAGNTSDTPPTEPSVENGSIAEGQELENGQQPNLEENTTGLSEDNLAFLQSKGYKGSEDLDKIVTSYNELEKLHSQSIITPETDDFTDESWDKFGKRVGAPEAVDAYEFEMPDLPDNVVYDQSLADDFKQIAHKYKVTTAQAQGMHNDFSKVFTDRQTGFQESTQESIGQAGQTLSNEWGGSPEHPQYKQNVSDAFKSMNATPGLIDAYVRAGILREVPGSKGQYNPTDASVVMAHAAHGAALMSEPSGEFDPVATGQNNPFSKENENMTKQGQIMRQDPELARALIKQAGKDPATYSLQLRFGVLNNGNCSIVGRCCS